MNTGAILPIIRPEDFRVAGETGIVFKEICQDWTPYLPKQELQYGTYVATQACTIFSALNCLETQLAQQGKSFNFSDRFTAKMCGNTTKGSQLTAVWDSLRKDGFALEDEWSFDRSREGKIGWEQFYSEIPQSVKDKAKTRLKDYTIMYEWVNMGDCHPNLEELKRHLKQAPLQLATSNNATCICEHATMLFKIDENWIYLFDSNSQEGIVKKPLSYPLPWLLKAVITPKIQLPDIGFIKPLTKDLKYGMNDGEVVSLKQGLIRIKYLSPLLAPNLTTLYGDATRSAVLRFQKANGVCILCVSQGKVFTLNSRTKFNSLIQK